MAGAEAAVDVEEEVEGADAAGAEAADGAGAAAEDTSPVGMEAAADYRNIQRRLCRERESAEGGKREIHLSGTHELHGL